MAEKCFTPGDLPHLTIGAGNVYAIASQKPGDIFQPAGEAANGTALWRLEDYKESVVATIGLRENPTVQGVSILTAHSTPEAALSLPFASYLTELRAIKKDMKLPCIMSAERPEVPQGYIRLPHLVSYSPSDKASLEDHVIWEVLSSSEAERWLGNSLPDQQFIEKHLPQLLELRATYRAKQLPDTRRCRELERLLNQGRYLSILFVYQYFPLFEVLLQEKPLARTIPSL